MMYDSSTERLNAIGEKLGGINRYLEVGVAKGDTFFNINAREKHAVDPRFRFDPGNRKGHPNEIYHCSTSDEFFFNSLQDQIKPFDLIFLDGLHTYSQTLRDFLSSQVFAHKDTIWLIDDTVPIDPISADPSLERVRAARLSEGHPENQTWMGDVYKLIVFISSFCPQFSCYTTEGHGQTIVLPKPIQSHAKYNYNANEIDAMNYVDLLLLRDSILQAIPFHEILKLI